MFEMVQKMNSTMLMLLILTASLFIIIPISFGTNLLTSNNTIFDVLIVGAGLSGAVVADVLTSKGFKVLVIDRRSHIAGNCYDYVDKYGILIHQYGPHIFHTNSWDVWNYISHKAEFRHYVHFINAYVDGQYVPFPVNRMTLNMLFQLDLNDTKDVEVFLKNETKDYQNIEVTNSEELILKTFGKRIYEAFYKNYNIKMWKMPASKLAAAVSARIPWRKSAINRYFDDFYQALPAVSYTNVVQQLLANSTVLLNTEFKQLNPKYTFRKVYHTGLIDGICEFNKGVLPYLSLNITFKTYPEPLNMLPAAVINYPNDNTYHRIFEAKWINPVFSDNTTISYETSTLEGEPYYAIPNITNQALYDKYRQRVSALKRMLVYGRLGDYKYYNMDTAIARALEIGRTTFHDIKSFPPTTVPEFLKEIKKVCDKD